MKCSGELTVSDPSTMPIEELSKLAVQAADLVPEDRKQELANYRASLQRPVPQPWQVDTREEDANARREQERAAARASLRSETTPTVKRGPRGGRYTEARTQEGLPYRRYF